MKKYFTVLLSLIFILALGTKYAFATAPTLAATVTNTTITATLQLPPDALAVPGTQINTKYKLIVSKQPITSGTNVFGNFSTSQSFDASGKSVFTYDTLTPDTKFYIRAEEDTQLVSPTVSNTIEITTGKALIYGEILKIEGKSDHAILYGKVDPVKNPNFKSLKARAYVTDNGKFYDLHDAIADDGTYTINIPNLTPSMRYSLMEKIYVDGDEAGGLTLTQDFNSSTGTIVEGSKDEINSFENRSYRLLAPFPGLTVLLNPDLCMEQQKLGKPVFGDSCDNQIGAFLNYMFKILIGLAAVFLVIRIMYEGYVYLTTDTPFKVSSSKAAIFQALAGLALALTAYLILNTINPKLVENDVKLDNLALGVAPISDAEQYRLEQTQGSASSKVFKRSAYYAQIKAISAQNGIPQCLLQVAIQREAAGGATGSKLIGHDEDVASAGIRSRREFIASGKKANGTTFTSASITDKSFMNTDHPSNNYHAAPNPSAADLGIDWRFSHSVGMFGTTFGPNNLNPSGAKAIYDSTDADISLAAKNMLAFYKLCNATQGIEGVWRAYAQGSKCTGGNSFVTQETAIRTDLYNQCVKQDS